MSLQGVLAARLARWPAVLVLLFSATLLLPGGCPRLDQGPSGDSIIDETNDDGLGPDVGNPDDDSTDPSSGDQDGTPDPGKTDPGDSPSDSDDDPPLGPAPTAGDMNGDGKVEASDIRGFVLAIVDPVAYKQAYPNGDPMQADANGDGNVNLFDIDPFCALVLDQ
ncbi:MAG TPA: hypothetical protein P5255_14800 [Phycisphaerae bacterium]|nr:hypothetical protein [Phycisphaerae bacterium]